MNRQYLIFARILSLLLTTSVTAEGTLTYPCPHPTNPGPPPSAQLVPKLPAQFVVHVEAHIVQKQTTAEAVEVYDYPNKRAAISITTNNQTVTSFFYYDTNERLDILPSGACLALNLSETSFDVFGFTELRTSGRPHIMSAAEVFRFGDKFPKVFIGEESVRGVGVYHWQSCQNWTTSGMTRAAYVIDYYFSKPGYSTATAETMIPIRATINGTAINVDNKGRPIAGTHNFSHVYDFSFFRPGPVQDESFFEIPRGTVCNRTVSKTLPQLPDQFSLSMEVYLGGSNRPPRTETMLFDYDFGLIQTDRFAPRGTGERFGLTKLTIVEDYNNHVQYVVDSYDGNCSINPLPEGLSTSEGGEGSQITMKHGQQLLLYGKRNFKYQGQRWLRDMKVDVWADATEAGMVQEVYFLANWPTQRLRRKLLSISPDLDLSRMNMLVGTYLINTSAIDHNLGPFFQLFGDKALEQWGDHWQRPGFMSMSSDTSLPRPGDLLRLKMRRRQIPWDSARMHFADANEKMINIFNYLPMHMDLSAFDVSMCYKNNAQEMYVFFMVEGNYVSLVTSQRYILLSSVRSAVAKAAGISMLRVTKINVWQDLVSSKLSVFLSLLEPPPVFNQAQQQLSCKEAYKKLAEAVSKGLAITIKHPIKKRELHVVIDSIKSWNSLEEMWNKVLPGSKVTVAGLHLTSTASPDQQPQSDSDSSGYTAGEFGGMAFAMLVVGVLVGVVGMYVVLRRLRPDINLLPYQQSK